MTASAEAALQEVLQQSRDAFAQIAEGDRQSALQQRLVAQRHQVVEITDQPQFWKAGARVKQRIDRADAIEIYGVGVELLDRPPQEFASPTLFEQGHL